MTDIDFDELDKAVNTLMGDKALSQSKPESAIVDTPEKSNAEPSVAEPEADTANESTPPSVQTPDTRPAALAVKRRGQFMDVMHPSADMTNSRTARPAAKVSRHGVSLAPAVPATPPASPPSVAAEPSEEPSPDTTAPAITPEAPVWPDPINFDEQSTDEAEPPVAATPAPVEAPTPIAADVPAEPLSSPFLPDAKVEKRPLGEALPTGTGDMPAVASEPAASVSLPDELSGDILKIESNELEIEPEVAPAPAPEAPQAAEATEVTDEPAPAASAPSIPPQYRTDDSKDEPAEHSALYDEVAATQAAVPAKKKNGWLVPVAIIGLIILGCAGGVFVYYYMVG